VLSLWRNFGEILKHGYKSLRSDFHRAGERMINFHNGQQAGKIRIDKAPVISDWAQIFGTEKEGESDGQKGAPEKHHPNDCGHDAIGHDTTFAPSLTEAVDLP
jgi:hypothetical protein